jgi:hypothetical protein
MIGVFRGIVCFSLLASTMPGLVSLSKGVRNSAEHPLFVDCVCGLAQRCRENAR